MTEELFDEFTDGFTDELSEDSEGGVAVAVAEPKAAAVKEKEAAAVSEEKVEEEKVLEEKQEEIVEEENEEDKKAEEGKEVRFDIDLDTGMEWEVETVPPEEPKRVYRPSYDHRYRHGRYDRPSHDHRYRQSRYDTNNRNGEVPVARRLNKHLFTWLFSFYLGMFGVDRFVRGQVGLGILKLITFGGFGVWYTLDWVIALIKSYGPGSAYGNVLEFDYNGQYID